MSTLPFIQCRQYQGEKRYGTFKTPVNTNPDPQVGLFELPINYHSTGIEIKIYEDKYTPKYTFRAVLYQEDLIRKNKVPGGGGGMIPCYYTVVLPYETLYVELYFRVETYPTAPDHVSVYLTNLKYRVTEA